MDMRRSTSPCSALFVRHWQLSLNCTRAGWFLVVAPPSLALNHHDHPNNSPLQAHISAFRRTWRSRMSSDVLIFVPIHDVPSRGSQYHLQPNASVRGLCSSYISVMKEALQNHTPQTIVVDEVSNKLEARACLDIKARYDDAPVLFCLSAFCFQFERSVAIWNGALCWRTKKGDEGALAA